MELIKIESNVIGNGAVNSVNSRDIHSSLWVKTPYSMWIQRAIEKYGFEENTDFTINKFVIGKATQIDYIVTLDMAKELCMLDDSEMGKSYRRYFIEKEKEATRPMTIQEQIAIIAKGNQIIDERLTLLEQTKRLEAWQERSLSDAKNKKVYSFNPSDGENTSKLHRAVWSKFKKHFNLPRYNELPAVKYEQGLDFINRLTLIDLV